MQYRKSGRRWFFFWSEIQICQTAAAAANSLVSGMAATPSPSIFGLGIATHMNERVKASVLMQRWSYPTETVLCYPIRTLGIE